MCKVISGALHVFIYLFIFQYLYSAFIRDPKRLPVFVSKEAHNLTMIVQNILKFGTWGHTSSLASTPTYTFC